MSSIQKDSLLPCPHCGSTDIRTDPIMFCDDDGEHAGVECLSCDAIARYERWNQRTALQPQQSLEGVASDLQALLQRVDNEVEFLRTAADTYEDHEDFELAAESMRIISLLRSLVSAIRNTTLHPPSVP